MKVFLLGLLLFSPVQDEPISFDTGTVDDQVEIKGTEDWRVLNNSQADDENNVESVVGGSADVVPDVWYTFDPYCRSKADLAAEIADYCFGGANARCSTEGERLYQLRVHTRENPEGVLTNQQRCLGDSEAVPVAPDGTVAPPVDVVTMSNQEFRSFAIPASELVMQQPVEGRASVLCDVLGEGADESVGREF